jgi:GTP cyclohydrolase II
MSRAITAAELSGLIAVERAIAELRRGTPVIVQDGALAWLVLAAETLEAATLAAVIQAAHKKDPGGQTAIGDLRLILTHPRAQTLKIRLYTPEIVSLAGVASWPLETIRALVDPCLDLDTPLKGPFDAERLSDVPKAYGAGVKLAKLARLLPGILIAPLVDKALYDTVLSGKDMITDYLSVSVEAIANYEHLESDSLKPIVTAHIPLADAKASRLVAFRPADGGPEHLAIIIGTPALDQPVLTRLHSECFTGDLIGSLKCDCGEQLRGAIAAMEAAGGGIVLYLAQEGRGIGLINKLRAYRLQDQGFDTVEANERLGFDADERLFQPAAAMLRALGYSRIKLMTNNPDKVQALEGFGIIVTERVAHKFAANPHNEFYLSVKRHKSGHLL